MTGTLAIFADQVTTVAREVGVEGRLGGQANVPGAAGTWKDLTGNVNLLAANLTNLEQVVLATSPDNVGQYGVEINKISGLTISLPVKVPGPSLC